jgi:hypothetical protein
MHIIVLVFSNCYKKHHRQGGWKMWIFVCHSSRGWKFMMKARTGSVSSEGCSLVHGWHFLLGSTVGGGDLSLSVPIHVDPSWPTLQMQWHW